MADQLWLMTCIEKKIRILCASLAQTATEMAEKYAKLAEVYAKLGKAAKLHSIIRYWRKESGSWIRTTIRIGLKN